MSIFSLPLGQVNPLGKSLHAQEKIPGESPATSTTLENCYRHRGNPWEIPFHIPTGINVVPTCCSFLSASAVRRATSCFRWSTSSSLENYIQMCTQRCMGRCELVLPTLRDWLMCIYTESLSILPPLIMNSRRLRINSVTPPFHPISPELHKNF